MGMTLATGATLLATAAPAAASAVCTTWKVAGGTGGSAKCTGGNTRLTTHRVRIQCVTPHGSKFNVWGPWKDTRGGQTSTANCGGGGNVGVVSVSSEVNEPV
ncbi:hypothetical protein [Microtetraspora glauca]|uniref:hypothetical protein n=1 Tax=unclassified Streptomyces TaxID=2593676 RepID=UPI002AA5258D